MPENVEILRSMYDALVAGRMEEVFGYVDDGIKTHVPGHSLVSGEYDGKAALAGYVTKLAELSGGTLRFEVHDVLADDTHGVGLVRDIAERAGKRLAVNNVHLWHMAGGKLTEFWVYPGDAAAWDDFWS